MTTPRCLLGAIPTFTKYNADISVIWLLDWICRSIASGKLAIIHKVVVNLFKEAYDVLMWGYMSCPRPKVACQLIVKQ